MHPEAYLPCRGTSSDTGEFEDWWNALGEGQQVSVDASVRLIERYGPMLPYPSLFGGALIAPRFDEELRVQHAGKPPRVLYAFDSRRMAILLVGGDKTGNRRWYEDAVPRADALYDRHLRALTREDDPNG